MLIVKKYHDYYDSAIGYGGVDKTCVYERVSKEELDDNEFIKIRQIFDGKRVRWDQAPYSYNLHQYRYKEPIKGEPWLIEPFIIGFCGKTYVGYVFKWYIQTGEDKIKIVYGPDDFFKMVKFDMKNAYGVKGKKSFESTKQYFDEFHNKKHINLFFKYRVPVWVYDYGTELLKFSKKPRSNVNFMLNPPLITYEFYQMFTPPIAFQEIQMYLQGVIGNKEKKIVEISDKDKLLQHGYDLKWSFRNPCGPRRKKGKCET